MPTRYFLRTMRQHHSAPTGTKISCDGTVYTKRDSPRSWASGDGFAALSSDLSDGADQGHRHEVIRWGSGVVFTEVSRTLNKAGTQRTERMK